MNERLIRIGTRAWIAVTGIAFAVLAGMSADAALKAISKSPEPVAAVQVLAPPMVAADAPAPGVTGTTDLPALPIPAAWQANAAADGSVQPAVPFSTAAASLLDRGRALECLTAAIYYEAASEPDAGQEAVAQVILNRVRHPAFPATVCGVVYQGTEKGGGCQFSFACDGAMARIPSRAGWARAARAASLALSGFVYTPVGLATHYHTYAVTPAWNRSLVMTDVVGAHFFHRLKGYWGTPMAFHQRYVGGEPMPGPHAVIAPTDGAPLAAVVYAATAPVSVTPPAIPDTYTEAGAARAADAAPTDALPPTSQILDKWKDSGKALR